MFKHDPTHPGSRPRGLGMLEAAYRVPRPLGGPGTAHAHSIIISLIWHRGTVPRVFRRGSLACSRSPGTAEPSSLRPSCSSSFWHFFMDFGGFFSHFLTILVTQVRKEGIYNAKQLA